MAIKCPKCERLYEFSVFDAAQRVFCVCGENLRADEDDVFERLQEICGQYEFKLEEEKAAQIRKMADSIVSLILNTDNTWIEVELEKDKLKNLIADILPEKMPLFELIYEPRFKRLWGKFRENGLE